MPKLKLDYDPDKRVHHLFIGSMEMISESNKKEAKRALRILQDFIDGLSTGSVYLGGAEEVVLNKGDKPYV